MILNKWATEGIVYHIYPLGLCGAPSRNDFYSYPQNRLDSIHQWIDHIKNLGVTIVYLGPLFESTSHGYDTSDYYHVDRRLGDRKTLANLVKAFHNNGIRVIFDAVFNHVGRNFWAFRDLQKNRQYSAYVDWFDGLKFDQRSPLGDPFTYKAWKKHYELVALNLKNPQVKEHLFKAVEMWVNELGVDGIRLDAADCLKKPFIRQLKKYCKKLKPDFWILGEVVHGDYRKRTDDKMLDTVTNYQCYKELFHSFNHKDFSETAKAFQRQFGYHGAYNEISTYSFLDNHDVSRIATNLKNKAHLYPLYALLFTMKGIPSIYYGSEFAIKGKKHRHSDYELRPYLDLAKMYKNSGSDLINAIKKFINIRKSSNALCYGGYRELFVSNELFSFSRISHNEYIIVIINASFNNASVSLKIPEIANARVVDVLNNNEIFYIKEHFLNINPIWSNWARILKVVF